MPESGPGAEGGGVWAQHAAAGKKKERSFGDKALAITDGAAYDAPVSGGCGE